MTTLQYVRGVNDFGWRQFCDRFWQRNYWEHIIRSGDSLERIRHYIRTNPETWETDRENRNRAGEDDFDRWIAGAGPNEKSAD